MSFYYLASAYSKHPLGREVAFQEVAAQAALLIEAGVPLFCPISHSHPISLTLDTAKDTHETWMAIDRPFMQAAKGLIVCKLRGWDTSRGVLEEIKHFQDAGKPIVYMDPGEVPLAVLPKRRRILAFCGVARSGKDSAAQGLIAEGWERVAFADGVREALAALNPWIGHLDGEMKRIALIAGVLGWDGAKKVPETRELLQRMGTEAGRNIHGNDCWIRLAQRKVEAAPGNVVISDCRFGNEAQAIRDWGGLVVRIERPGVTACNGHASEQLAFEPDSVIVNDGTLDELHGQVRSLVNCEALGYPRDGEVKYGEVTR